MWSDALVLIVSVFAGSVAAVTGFGIGSLLTPVLASSVDTRIAVAAVSIPHVVGTAVRFWLLQGGIDRRVLWSFGLTSAAGGLIGAAVYSIASNRWLNAVFGVLLLFAAFSEVTGLARRMRFRGWVAWLAGGLSGLLGGLVGNQGGIRSAALLGFNLSKEKFVGTATAIALVVDGARLPIYVAYQRDDILAMWPWIVLATAGVVGGTCLGSRVLRRVPEQWFRRILALILAILGSVMLARALTLPSGIWVDDHFWNATVQLRTTVSGATLLGGADLALTRNRCPSLVTA
jgi:uncharacterized membrane protein YfcA